MCGRASTKICGVRSSAVCARAIPSYLPLKRRAAPRSPEEHAPENIDERMRERRGHQATPPEGDAISHTGQAREQDIAPVGKGSAFVQMSQSEEDRGEHNREGRIAPDVLR